MPTEDSFWAAQAVSIDGFCHVAGQIAREPDGTPSRGRELASQFEKVRANLDIVLAKLDARNRDVVFARVYLARPIDPDDPTVPALVGASWANAAGVLVASSSFIAPEYLLEVSVVAAARPMSGRRKTVRSAWHDELGFSESVRVGRTVYVSGIDAGGPEVGPVVGDVVSQFVAALKHLGEALARAGASMGDVVSTQILVSELPEPQEAAAFAAAHHAAFFGETRPTSSLIGVRKLARAGANVELTAIAVLAACE